MTNSTYNIFKKGSRTYFYSSLFFPVEVKEDVFKLYAFVRVVDDAVDSIPQRFDQFSKFKSQFLTSWVGKMSGNDVVDAFVEMAKRRGFEKRWVEAFLEAMESDLNMTNTSYKAYSSYKELEKYMYGSAEVIGLMMAAIFFSKNSKHQIPNSKFAEVQYSARLLGRAMQYVNFIRDVQEDIELGRTYLPGLPDRKEPTHDKYIKQQLDLYFQWQTEAETGFGYLPRRYRVAVKTASDMYKWTAQQIYKNPKIIYRKKVKPQIWRVLASGLWNWLTL